ncbi:suppressor of fused domain protein [Duganella sp. Root336D2]|uniref:suppressor of fused domain protein n=1 Tax=Duganella sp. Root336D2 TaxID=1736518 RepID=UPI0006FFC5B5|nr:suppressor of fused domain protein [Duganella sp. Root336D2]KQV49831.1 hypothetical protein ASD07_29730 [Duganella sp. Root336D2]
MNKEEKLSFDVRRTVLLGAYMKAWGMPMSRVLAEKDDHIVEAYFFPASADGKINRYVTMGVSGHCMPNGKVADWELLLALPTDNGGASEAEVISFLFDVMAYSLSPEVPFKLGLAIPESKLAPRSWAARALLIDEPRAEPEHLTEIQVGEESVKLLWIVPIHRDECELIYRDGLEAFDDAEAASQWSPADPCRPSFLSKNI